MRVTIVAGPDSARMASALVPLLAADDSLALVGAVQDTASAPATSRRRPPGTASPPVDDGLRGAVLRAGVVGGNGRTLVVVPPGAPVLRALASVLAAAAGSPQITLDGVVVALDGPTLSVRLVNQLPVCDPVDRPGLAIADVVAVGRAAGLTCSAVSRGVEAVRAVNHHGRVVLPGRHPTPVATFVELDAWSATLSPAPGHESVTFDGCFRLPVPAVVRRAELERWYAAVSGASPDAVWRLQGRVHLAGEGMVAVAGVGSTLLVADQPWRAEHGSEPELVVIGPTLDAVALAASLGTLG
jgi:G3E family GTPase